MPGSIDQVALVPVIMNVAGALFVQLGAIRSRPGPGPATALSPIVWTLATLAIVLAIFQFMLRPGLDFF